MTKKMQDLLNKREKLVSDGEKFAEENKLKELEDINNQIANLDTEIQVLKNFEEAAKKNHGEPSDNGLPIITSVDKDKEVKPFKSLGEQLKAIANWRQNNQFDNRLKVVNEAQGNSSLTGPDGGYAIQSDFAGMILDTAIENSEILRRCSTYNVSSQSNSAKWLKPKDNNSSSIFGGIKMNWAGEAATAEASKAEFVETKLDLEKMMGFAYATEELLQDTAFMTSLFGRAFTIGADQLLTEGVVNGDGVGKPLGILKSKAIVSVDKENNQAAKSIVAKNIAKMYSLMLQKNKKNAVWILHPDVAAELPFMTMPIGTGGVSVYLPATGLAGNQYDTLFGKPIIEDDNCQALGSKGDIVFADLSQYMLLKKGTIKQDVSIHVEFLTAQSCFRYIMRCNGAPMINEPYTIKNSSQKRSPFITLANRA